jgi:ABC-type molybdate transport system substrate-binding protein
VAGLAASKSAHVKAYLDFLQTRAAKTIFNKYGFSFLVPPKAS